jgi:hypothetical protein
MSAKDEEKVRQREKEGKGHMKEKIQSERSEIDRSDNQREIKRERE